MDLIARWTAKRYTRPAFPDAFNQRLKPERNKVERVLRANGHLISAVYLEPVQRKKTAITVCLRQIYSIWQDML